MRWKIFVKQALNHPYFDDRKHMLSDAQAEAILSSGYMNFGEFMESVQQRIDEINRGVRKPIDLTTILPKHEEPVCEKSHMKVGSRLLRNVAIASISAILLAAFLAFTNPGRAIAQAIYKAIVSVIDGKLSGMQTVPDNRFGAIDIDNLPAEFSSVEEATEWIPLSVAAIDSDKYKLQEIAVLSADETHMTLRSTYTDEEGATFSIIQQFYAPGVSWGNSTTADENGIERFELSNGLAAYIGIMDDGTVFAVIYVPEGVIQLTSMDLSVENLFALLDSFYLR